MIEAHGNFYSFSIKFRTVARRRGITIEEVELTVQEPDERVESEHDPRQRILYRKLVSDRWITVVVDEGEQMLITVWASPA
jgi:cytidylate kinase